MTASTQKAPMTSARRVMRRVYVPPTVAMVVGWPGASGLANRAGAEGRSQVFEELLVRGLAVVAAWDVA
ncbi:MAG: hypothetical protein ABSA91_19185 [Acidimicrobiales bacterium]|jgi:hypothetical protein